MSTALHRASGSLWRDLGAELRYRAARIDRPAWRRFFLAVFALTFAFFLAIYSAALNTSGRHDLGAMSAAASLLLAGIVAFKVVPYLARRTALERWLVQIEYEFTREGVVYLAVIAVIVIAALNTGNNLLYIILASLLAGILVSGVLSRIVLSELELEVALPEHIFAGEALTTHVSLTNLKWVFPSFSVTVSGREPDSGKKKKKAGPAPSVERKILEQAVYVPYVPRRARVTQHVELTFPRRGRYTEEGFRVSSKFPFGFLKKTHELPVRQEILVLPSVQPTEEFYDILPLVSGEVESLHKGRGHDLYAIRNYLEGDSARHLDWKATAKTQELKVREFTREDERRVVLAFDPCVIRDDSATLGKFEKAVTLCACLAWHFYEIDAQMQFLCDSFETGMAKAAEILYPALEKLALVGPVPCADRRGSANLIAQLASAERGFNIILTGQPRGSIPTSLWASSYLVFFDSL